MAARLSATRSETLSLRLEPRTRFHIEFIARVRRLSTTSVVETAIRRLVADVTINDRYDKQGNLVKGRDANDYWNVVEGIREIHLFADAAIPKSFDEEEKLEFVKWHIEFFSNTNRLDDLDPVRVDTIWPKISDYVALWRGRKIDTDIWEAGRQMSGALEARGLDAPAWPRHTTKPPAPIFTKDELDDEIPF